MKLPKEVTHIEPYRIFFPLGVLFGIFGVSIWPVYYLGWISTIQSWWHIDLQLHGFLTAFVLGFLLTALPRFSLTWPATKSELFSLAFFFLGSNLGTLFGFRVLGRLGYIIALSLLAAFAIKRFSHRKVNPPAEFLMVGMAILLALLGASLRLFGFEWMGNPQSDIIGRRVLAEGMMLMLVLGIGSKLMPLFFGHTLKFPIPIQPNQKEKFTKKHIYFGSLGMILAFSFIAEYFLNEHAAYWLRFIASLPIFLHTMKLCRWPKTKGINIKFLWFSMWMICLSLFGTAIHPEYRIPVLHAMFIPGFGILILCIATRVILSHGGWAVDLEKRSKALLLGGILLIGASGFRSLAPLFPESYFRYLAIGGAGWIIGLLIWGIPFSLKAIRVQKQ